MKYYLIAGEASGDLHASHLMWALKEIDKETDFRFFGGDLMSDVGGTRVRHYRDLAYMGVIPVLLHLPTILKNMKFCKQDILTWQPDCVILIDYPGFNLKIAEYVKSRTNIPVYYYISPKISGLGRNTASRISVVISTNSFPSCHSKWIFSRRSIIIRSTMWVTLRLMK